jgi:hypothetical protein
MSWLYGLWRRRYGPPYAGQVVATHRAGEGLEDGVLLPLQISPRFFKSLELPVYSSFGVFTLLEASELLFCMAPVSIDSRDMTTSYCVEIGRSCRAIDVQTPVSDRG